MVQHLIGQIVGRVKNILLLLDLIDPLCALDPHAIALQLYEVLALRACHSLVTSAIGRRVAIHRHIPRVFHALLFWGLPLNDEEIQLVQLVLVGPRCQAHPLT